MRLATSKRVSSLPFNAINWSPIGSLRNMPQGMDNAGAPTRFHGLVKEINADRTSTAEPSTTDSRSPTFGAVIGTLGKANKSYVANSDFHLRPKPAAQPRRMKVFPSKYTGSLFQPCQNLVVNEMVSEIAEKFAWSEDQILRLERLRARFVAQIEFRS